ncbi:MAG TPA: creatininase family protein [Geminicoccaceae bacterium]|nr:creatininase family protein [Geminicoccaceae bacterium]
MAISVDVVLPTAVSERVARRVGGLVAPTLPYGYKSQPRFGGGETFPGTTSLDANTFSLLVRDVIRVPQHVELARPDAQTHLARLARVSGGDQPLDGGAVGGVAQVRDIVEPGHQYALIEHLPLALAVLARPDDPQAHRAAPLRTGRDPPPRAAPESDAGRHPSAPQSRAGPLTCPTWLIQAPRQ